MDAGLTDTDLFIYSSTILCHGQQTINTMKQKVNYLWWAVIVLFLLAALSSCTKQPACYKVSYVHRLSSGVHKAETTHWKYRDPFTDEIYECWKEARTKAIKALHPSAYSIDFDTEDENSAPLKRFNCE